MQQFNRNIHPNNVVQYYYSIATLKQICKCIYSWSNFQYTHHSTSPADPSQRNHVPHGSILRTLLCIPQRKHPRSPMCIHIKLPACLCLAVLRRGHIEGSLGRATLRLVDKLDLGPVFEHLCIVATHETPETCAPGRQVILRWCSAMEGLVGFTRGLSDRVACAVGISTCLWAQHAACVVGGIPRGGVHMSITSKSMCM